jgi:hypothetical protein
MDFNRCHGRMYHLLHSKFLYGLNFDPEDGGIMFLQTLVFFYRTPRRCIPGDGTLEVLSREYFVRFAESVFKPFSNVIPETNYSE